MNVVVLQDVIYLLFKDVIKVSLKDGRVIYYNIDYLYLQTYDDDRSWLFWR